LRSQAQDFGNYFNRVAKSTVKGVGPDQGFKLQTCSISPKRVGSLGQSSPNIAREASTYKIVSCSGKTAIIECGDRTDYSPSNNSM